MDELILVTFPRIYLSVSWKSIERHHRRVLTGYRWKQWLHVLLMEVRRWLDERSKHSSEKKKNIFRRREEKMKTKCRFLKKEAQQITISQNPYILRKKPIWIQINKAQRFGRSRTRVVTTEHDSVTWIMIKQYFI